ncbi:discoidin domain-containing protein, partial [Akkermansiaceae bacterium]|nr:discoidin domain-containing protein [Akkermansiaceae bacterium]
VTDFTSFTSTTTHVNNSDPDAWATSGNSAVLIFDFGSSQTVSEFAFWGDNGSNSNNIDLFTIDVSNDPGFAVFTSLGGGNGPLTNSDPVDAAVYDITDGTGRYVRLSANNQGGGFVILGEVAFAGTAIPEPSSSLLLGFGVFGLATLRRRIN